MQSLSREPDFHLSVPHSTLHDSDFSLIMFAVAGQCERFDWYTRPDCDFRRYLGWWLPDGDRTVLAPVIEYLRSHRV